MNNTLLPASSERPPLLLNSGYTKLLPRLLLLSLHGLDTRLYKCASLLVHSYSYACIYMYLKQIHMCCCCFCCLADRHFNTCDQIRSHGPIMSYKMLKMKPLPSLLPLAKNYALNQGGKMRRLREIFCNRCLVSSKGFDGWMDGRLLFSDNLSPSETKTRFSAHL